MVQITSVRFGLTKNLGNYESVRLDAEAAVNSSDESPEQALEHLKSWVACQLGQSPELEDAQKQLEDARFELSGYLAKIQTIRENYRTGLECFQALKERYLEAEGILERYAVKASDNFPEDPEKNPIPF